MRFSQYGKEVKLQHKRIYRLEFTFDLREFVIDILNKSPQNRKLGMKQSLIDPATTKQITADIMKF